MERIIYGAGDYGKKLYTYFAEKGDTVDFFCQTTVQADTYLYNTKIISLNELLNLNDAEIFIALSNAEESALIKDIITARKSVGFIVYECGDFIRKNLEYKEEDFYCNLCGKGIKKFYEDGSTHEVFKKYHIIGGGYRKNVLCPNCRVKDRTRWTYRVLLRYTDIFTSNCKVLHFAPEKSLSEKIRSNRGCDYYPGDLIGGKTRHCVDMLDIQFRDDYFDFIIANHVLEHIKNEKRAVCELMRVLKPRGILVLSFPICTDMETIEEGKENLNSSERLGKFGQEDHVRLYGNDYKERLERYGLNVQVISPIHVESEYNIRRYGFIPDDICLICTKKEPFG